MKKSLNTFQSLYHVIQFFIDFNRVKLFLKKFEGRQRFQFVKEGVNKPQINFISNKFHFKQFSLRDIFYTVFLGIFTNESLRIVWEPLLHRWRPKMLKVLYSRKTFHISCGEWHLRPYKVIVQTGIRANSL